MLELEHVGFEVQTENGAKTIICDINLRLSERFVAFTGPNGGGKSTLAKLIMGLYRPTTGRILLNGRDITDLSVTERAKLGVCYGFQQPVRFKGITVHDLLSVAAGHILSVGDACRYLADVGLCAKEYVHREIDAKLSGGELKRIEIATVMARGAELTVFDEPEAGIDLWSFNNLITVFEDMYNKIKGTMLIISHQERILNIADRIIVLSAGQVEQDGTKDEVLPTLLTTTYCDRLRRA